MQQTGEEDKVTLHESMQPTEVGMESSLAGSHNGTARHHLHPDAVMGLPPKADKKCATRDRCLSSSCLWKGYDAQQQNICAMLIACCRSCSTTATATI